MITDEWLTERIDPALAVDRALTGAERTAFLEHILVGQYDGAQPSDWIDEAGNADAYGAGIGSWWDRYGDKALDVFLVNYELPEVLTRRLLNAALVAMYGMVGSKMTTDHRRTPIEIAAGASLWARGYAEALGWAPGTPGASR